MESAENGISNVTELEASRLRVDLEVWRSGGLELTWCYIHNSLLPTGLDISQSTCIQILNSLEYGTEQENMRTVTLCATPYRNSNPCFPLMFPRPLLCIHYFPILHSDFEP